LTLLIGILVIVLLVQGILSLAQGVRFARFVRHSLEAPAAGSTPRASIIAPIKGLESGLQDNIKLLFSQNYPIYEIIFVIAEFDDPARRVIEEAIADNPSQQARLIIAGAAAGRGQKVNNLLHGVARSDPGSEILVFVDSDASVSSDWLRALVAALGEPAVGASTGYRWYLPATGGFWSKLVSAWNGAIATTLGNHGRNFAWGGSTAIRRDTFDRIEVARHWDNALSDDYALTRAVQQAGLRITFVPRCLALTREDFGLRSALEFTRRQVTIARVYKRSAWAAGMITQSLFVAGFFGGIVWAICTVIVASPSWGLLVANTGASAADSSSGFRLRAALIAALLVIYVLGCLKGWLRLRTAGIMLPRASSELRRTRIMFYLLWPVVSLMFLYDFLASAATRKITWRGISYEMRSPTETVIIDPNEN
jgi:cellulose synthase/poly-beta-1,6-N-acetylglucosamine synthase-like glycosyltransferase